MSFLGSFFSPGSSQIKKGAKKADEFYVQGQDAALPHYQDASGRLDPYAQGGGQAFNALLNATGVNGAAGQQQFMDSYLEDPTQNLMQQAVARQMAARGLTDSGASRLAAGRVWQEGYGNHLNRLMQIGGQGQQAAAGQATIDTGMGDLKFGTSQLRANNQINKANALATSQQAGVNNLLNLGGMALKATGVGGYGA